MADLHEVIAALARNVDLSHSPSDLELVETWLEQQQKPTKKPAGKDGT